MAEGAAAEPAAEAEVEAEEEGPGELRQYLDEGGVLDAWSKCLVALYQEKEKPEQPIEFVEEWFGQKKNAEIAELKDKIAALEESLATAQEEITTLKLPPEAAEDEEH